MGLPSLRLIDRPLRDETTPRPLFHRHHGESTVTWGRVVLTQVDWEPTGPMRRIIVIALVALIVTTDISGPGRDETGRQSSFERPIRSEP